MEKHAPFAVELIKQLEKDYKLQEISLFLVDIRDVICYIKDSRKERRCGREPYQKIDSSEVFLIVQRLHGFTIRAAEKFKSWPPAAAS